MAIDTAIALISLADAKAFLKITASSEDGIVGDMVNEISQFVNNHCGHNILETTYTEYYDGDGTNELILGNFPVSTLTSVNDDVARSFSASTAKSVASDILLEKGAGIIRLWNNGGIFMCGQGNVKVVYVAGYTLATVPHPIQLAVRKLVAMLYRRSYQTPKDGVQTETQQDRTTTFFDEAIPKDVTMMLQPYRVIGGGARSFA